MSHISADHSGINEEEEGGRRRFNSFALFPQVKQNSPGKKRRLPVIPKEIQNKKNAQSSTWTGPGLPPSCPQESTTMLSGAVGTRPEAWVDLRNLSGYFVVACSRLCFADSRLPPPLPPLPPVSSSSFLASPFGRRACSGRTSDRTGGRVRACSSLPRVQVLPLASPRVPVVSRFFFFF